MGGVLLAFLILSCGLTAAGDLDHQKDSRGQNSGPSHSIPDYSELYSERADNALESLGSQSRNRIQPTDTPFSISPPIQFILNPESSPPEGITEKHCILETVANSPLQALEFDATAQAVPSAKCDVSVSVPSSVLRSALLNQASSHDAIVFTISLKLLIANDEFRPQTTTSFSEMGGFESEPATPVAGDANGADSSTSPDTSAAVPETTESDVNRPEVCKISGKDASTSENFFSRTALRLEYRRQKCEMKERQRQVELKKMRENDRLRKERLYRRSCSPNKPPSVTRIQTIVESDRVPPQQIPGGSSQSPSRQRLPSEISISSRTGLSRDRAAFPSLQPNGSKQSVISGDPERGPKVAVRNDANKLPVQALPKKELGERWRRAFKRRQDRDALRNIVGGAVTRSRANWHFPGPESRRYILQQIAESNDSKKEGDIIADCDELDCGFKRPLWRLDSGFSQVKIRADESRSGSDVDPEELRQIDQILAHSHQRGGPGFNCVDR